MKPFYCPRCNEKLRLVFAGNDDGGRVKEVCHPAKRRRTRLVEDPDNPGERKWESKVERRLVGHKLVKYFPDPSTKRNPYRIELACGDRVPGTRRITGGCGMVIAARGPSGALIRCAVRRRIAQQARIQRAAR